MKSDEAKRKKLYVERDISWMYFNQRILLEAARPEVPLLEQLTFLGIYSNNLDEFFRVRVATLNRIVEYDDKNIREERDTAARTLKQIGKLHNQYYRQFEETFASIMKEFEKYYGINIHITTLQVQTYLYTGKFRQTDGVDYALRVLQKDIKFAYERDEDNHIIYIK